jgi:hypothetical protein
VLSLVSSLRGVVMHRFDRETEGGKLFKLAFEIVDRAGAQRAPISVLMPSSSRIRGRVMENEAVLCELHDHWRQSAFGLLVEQNDGAPPAIAAMIASRTTTTSPHPSGGEIPAEAQAAEQRVSRLPHIGLRSRPCGDGMVCALSMPRCPGRPTSSIAVADCDHAVWSSTMQIAMASP